MKAICSRGSVFALTVVLSASLGACSGQSVVVPRHNSGPSPVPVPLSYTAIGASDAVGFGASVPCTTATPAVGPADPGCLNLTGTGYVPDLARTFIKNGTSVTLDDLGFSGAVLGPDILAEINMFGPIGSADQCTPRGPTDAYPTDFITDEVPQIPANTNLVTIFAGGNDTNGLVNALGCGAGGATAQSQAAFIATWVTNFGNDLSTLIGDVRAVAPNAAIVIANLPNFSQIPVGLAVAGQDPAAGQALAAFSTGFDLNVIDPLASASPAIPVVDLLCNPASYNPSNFFTDGFHPNDAGYALLAAQFFTQFSLTPALPSTTCSEATTTSVLRQVLTHPIKDFARGVRR